MITYTTVFGTLQFEALHCWPDAPEEVWYLRNPHRHVFHVRFECPVTHDDRDIEFISMKHAVQHFCIRKYHKQEIGSTSCEMIARGILYQFPQISSVTVSEDNENGATVARK